MDSTTATKSRTRKQAEDEILAILDSLPDKELPKGRLKIEDGRITLWFERLSSGHILGTAKRNGERCPDVIRDMALTRIFADEASFRADRELLKTEATR